LQLGKPLARGLFSLIAILLNRQERRQTDRQLSCPFLFPLLFLSCPSLQHRNRFPHVIKKERRRALYSALRCQLSFFLSPLFSYPYLLARRNPGPRNRSGCTVVTCHYLPPSPFLFFPFLSPNLLRVFKAISQSKERRLEHW